MKTIVALGALLLGAGCIADQMTLNPLFTEAEGVSEPALVGTWVEDDRDPLVLTIRAAEDGYELTSTKEDRVSRPLAVRLGRIAGELYWDVTAGSDERSSDHLLPIHSLARIHLDGDRLVIAPLRSDWVKQALADGVLDTPHVEVDGDPLLIASSAELQRLVLEHGNDPGAFAEDPASGSTNSDTLVLQRTATPEPVPHPAAVACAAAVAR